MIRTLKILAGLAALTFATGTAAEDLPWPVEQPDAWLLAFVDVETTGLVPGYHEMIDIGIVVTTLDGTEQGEFFLRIQPPHPERIDEGARAVNAYDEARWNELGAVSTSEAIAEIFAFHESVADGRQIMMVAFNSQFDTAFLDHLLRTQERSWRELYHYFVLDVPSMAWSLGYRGLTGMALSEALSVPDEPRIAELHTGITGARLNARLYRALVELRKQREGEES